MGLKDQARKANKASPGGKAKASRKKASAKKPASGEDATKKKTKAAKRTRTARNTADADAVVSAVRKKLGKKSESIVALLGQEDVLPDVTEWISSGFPDLDRVLGGGWAVGRASEVYGDEGCGKTALGHRALRECQRMGGLGVLLDFEVALDKKKMTKMGIDGDRLVYISPDTAEEGWEAVWAIVSALKATPPDAPTLIVWDSIAAAVPKAEREGDMETASVGAHARVMTRGCNKMFREISRVRAHMLWINQNRSKIGGYSGWGGPQTETTGGRAIKFAASQRVANRVAKRIKPSTVKGTEPSGYLISTITDKCRLAPPHRKTEWVLDFTVGPSPELTMQHILTELGIIRRGKGPGRLRAPWTDRQFKRLDWLDEICDPNFRKGARKALQEVIDMGGMQKYRNASRSLDDEEEEE